MRRWSALGIGLLMIFGLALAQAHTLTVFRDGFDGQQVKWRRGPATVPAREEAHALTQQFSHSAPTSEYLRVACDQAPQELNPYAYYAMATPPAPISDDTAGTLWMRANRPGAQLLVRVVLPRERDPGNSNQPLTIVLPGEKYQLTGGRWQRLEVRRLPKALTDERQRLRAKLKKDIDTTDAYVDQMILNVYAGPGTLELWVDDLEISPVQSQEKQPAPANTVSRSKDATPTPPAGVKPLGPVPIEFQRDQLRVGGRAIIFRGIRHTDTPLKALKDAGLNTLFFTGPTPSAVAEEAVRFGFWLMPSAAPEGDGDAIGREVQRFASNDAVLAWHLGDWRASEQLETVTRAAAAIRAADPQRPVSCDVRDGFWSYSRQVDLIGVHRWPLFTGLELTRYRDWLVQRRNLCRPNSFLWAWVQTHLPEWYLDVVQPPHTAGGFSEPIGPHPEQIRVLTYLSLAAGMKGIAYYSDRALSDVQQGRDRLLQIALVNQELSLIEPLLVTAGEAPVWLDTSLPQVKAALFRCERGVLVMPIWLGDGTQYVPEQGASSRLVMTIPQVPAGTQAWEVSPGEVRSLVVQRVVGGTQVTLPEFDHAAAVVFTADTSPTGLIVRWQDQSRRMAPTAAQWSYDLANVTLSKVERVQAQLTQLGVALPESESLLRDAREKLTAARASYEGGDYRTAYRQAQRAQRPLRLLARSQWTSLVRGLDAPTASPYGVSYYSLPQHVPFIRQVGSASPGQNQLTDGSFETGREQPAGWNIVRNTLDEVNMGARITGDAADGQQALHMEVHPKQAPAGAAATPPPVALDRTFLGVESTPLRLTPGAIVRISCQVKIPLPLQASPDGLVLYDSAGGEALGIRITGAVPQWKRFTYYRRVPENGELRVIFALTGIGVALIDDVKVEVLATK